MFYEVLSSAVALYFYKSTICSCMEYCCHLWAGCPLVILVKKFKEVKQLFCYENLGTQTGIPFSQMPWIPCCPANTTCHALVTRRFHFPQNEFTWFSKTLCCNLQPIKVAAFGSLLNYGLGSAAVHWTFILLKLVSAIFWDHTLCGIYTKAGVFALAITNFTYELYRHSPLFFQMQFLRT